ncbi:hypothetical protein SLA_4994 [Streptomyces laurentii]|uniref:Uncharacterized protein n=1 Tax=Streptomyces laurentii TaxID=39478 RepID=A0A169NYS9_STRLU|nr:hypothetical protein SLA_4994 [Streptomyces laurentii]
MRMPGRWPDRLRPDNPSGGPAEGPLSGTTLERRQWSRALPGGDPRDPADGLRHGETPFVRLAPRLTEEAAP